MEVNKKEVPPQKASIAVPPRSAVTMGRAILREVASMAAARVVMANAVKAR